MIICKYLTRMPAYRITTSLVIAFMSPFFPVFDFIFSYAVVSVHIIAMRPVLCRRRYFFLLTKQNLNAPANSVDWRLEATVLKHTAFVTIF